MLIFKLLPRLQTDLVETKSVKFFRAGVQFRIPVDSMADYRDQCSFWNDLAGRKLETARIGDDTRYVD